MSKNLTSKASAAAKAATAWFPRIGQMWPGQGIYAGIVRGEPGKPDHHLFLSSDPDTFKKAVAWGGQGEDEPGAQSTLDGRANTYALVQSKHEHPAAQWAFDVKAEGHSDWYLPSRRELRLMWVNVPELFESGYYWSSTQYSPDGSWLQAFAYGYQYFYGKGYEARARAVRRLVIQ